MTDSTLSLEQALEKSLKTTERWPLHEIPIDPHPEFPSLIDNSARSNFVKCEQYWFRASVQQLRLAGAGSIHLNAGGALAKGLEVARRSYYEAEFPVDVAEEHGEMALVKAYGDPSLYIPAKQGDKSLDGTIRAYRSYLLEYPLATDIIRPYRSASGRIAAEFKFSIPLEIKHPTTGMPLLYGGKFDLLGYCDPDGKGNELLWTVDEKSTTALGDQWRNNWTLDSQFTGYCWASRHEGYPVAGTCVRGIGMLKQKTTHAEVFVYRPQWMIDRWLEQLYNDIELMIRAWEKHSYRYALDKHQCNSFGGCPFVTLCGSPEPSKWLSQYQVVPWSPLED